MSSEALVRQFRQDYRLFGARWTRFCRHYLGRDMSSVFRFIAGRYGDVPDTFRQHLYEEMSHGKLSKTP